MSDCDVCRSFDDSGSCDDFFYKDQRKARKPHQCYECQRQIQPGELYCRVGGKWDGDIWRASICRFCFEIAEVFSCGKGVMYGNLWEDFDDYLFEQLKPTSKCFLALTQEARDFLMTRWWNWKETA